MRKRGKKSSSGSTWQQRSHCNNKEKEGKEGEEEGEMEEEEVSSRGWKK